MIGKTYNIVRSWFTDRYPVDDVEEFAKGQAEKPLPPHVSYLHTFGSLALFLMVNQIVTGILLMVYYRPTEDTAFESVKYIMTDAQFGWLIRGLHSWGANIMIIVLVLHMFRTFAMGSFKKPRELTWVVGCVIFFVTLTFGFTGYLLPWNQLSYWATTVGTEVAGAVPYLGEFVRYLLRGGTAVGEETLSRFYVVHVVVLPWVLVGLVGLHIVLMRVQGLSPLTPVGQEPKLKKGEGTPFFPDHTVKEMVVFPMFLLAMIAIVVFIPVELGEKADPFVTPEGIKPEWYFLPMYQMLKYFPKLLGIVASSMPMIILILWPFLDRSRPRRPGQRPISMTIGVLALLAAIFFGVLGHYSETNVTVSGTEYHIDLYGVPHKVEDMEAHEPASEQSPLEEDRGDGTE